MSKERYFNIIATQYLNSVSGTSGAYQDTHLKQLIDVLKNVDLAAMERCAEAVIKCPEVSVDNEGHSAISPLAAHGACMDSEGDLDLKNFKVFSEVEDEETNPRYIMYELLKMDISNLTDDQFKTTFKAYVDNLTWSYATWSEVLGVDHLSLIKWRRGTLVPPQEDKEGVFVKMKNAWVRAHA